MKKQLYIFPVLLIIVSSVVFYCFWKDITMNEIDSYRPYTFTRKTLSNGLEVLLVEDNLPYLSLSIMFKEGSSVDPEDKQGLMSLLSELIDKGSKDFSATQVAENLELLGTSFLYNLDKDSVSFSVDTLSWLDKDILDIFSKIITQPAFSKEEFERARKKAINWVERSTEDFSFYSSRVFNKYLYESHPYGYYQNGNLKGLKNITLEDVRSFYNSYFIPEKAVLSVSGQFPNDIIQKLESSFGKWKPALPENKTGKQVSASVIPAVKKTEVLLVDNVAAIQSEIRIGYTSLNRSHPDYLAAKVANVILGGSFSSHLMNRIRVQKGLTYSISSYLSANRELGAFKMGLAVRNDKVGNALLEIIGVLENFYKEGITTEELKKAKQLLKNQFITGVSSADSFAYYLMHLNSQNIPYVYAEGYFKKLSALTLNTVNTIIKKHFQPHHLKILILTHADYIKSQLKDFEPVTIKSYKAFL